MQNWTKVDLLKGKKGFGANDIEMLVKRPMCFSII